MQKYKTFVFSAFSFILLIARFQMEKVRSFSEWVARVTPLFSQNACRQETTNGMKADVKCSPRKIPI